MTAIPNEKFIIYYGDPANAGQYLRLCGITSKGFSQTAKTTDTERPDCNDESLPSETLRGVDSIDWQITQDVVIKSEDLTNVQAYFDAGTSFPVKITNALPLANAGWDKTGFGVFTQLDMKVDHGGRAATVAITIMGNGKLTTVPASA